MTGGEVEFVFTGNTDQLKEKFKDTEKGLLGLTDIAEKAGETLDSVFDINKENINIQKQVISDLESKYKDLSKAIEDIAPGKAKLAMMKEAASIKVEIEAEKKSLIELENSLKSTETTYKSFQTKLNEVKNEMRELEITGQQNSSRYTELSQKAAEYQKANDAINNSLKALKDNAGLTALVETMGLASGVFSTFQGIVALTGDKNEDLEKIMIRLQSAIAVTVGIQQIQNSLSKESSLLQSIQAVQTLARAKADEIAAVSTGKATIAQRAFNLVAKANPYVLLAAAILSVAGAIYLFTRRTDEASNIQKKMNDALKESAANTAKELVELERLYRTATNDKLSREQRLKAVNDLKAAWPGAAQNIKDEIILTGKAADMYLKLKDAIMQKAKANAAQKILEDRYTDFLLEQEEIQKKITESTIKRNELKGEVQKGNKSKTIRVDGGDGKGQNITLDNEVLLRNERINLANLEKLNQNKIKVFENGNSALLNIIQTGNAAIDAATTAPPSKKGTGEWYQQEITRLEEIRQKAIVGSKEWKILGKQIEEYQNLLNPKKEKKPKKPKEKAEEFLPEGSVAEIQRRLSKIDEALSKTTNEEQISKLKAKRISTAKELTEAEKLIQIKTLQEQFDESEKLWQQYYSAVDSIGKSEADKIFGDLLKNDKASFEALKKQKEDLLAKGNLTDEEKNYFTFIDEKLNSMLGKKNQLDQFKQTIEETLSTLGTDAEKLNFINDKKTTANKTTGEYAALTEFENKILEEQKQRYQEFLAAHQSFEERRLEISEKYKTLREQNEKDFSSGKIDNKQFEVNKNKIDNGQKNETSALEIDIIKQSKEWEVAFGDMELMTTTSLNRILTTLLDFREKSKGTLTLSDAAELERAIENIRNAANQNPFSQIINNFREYRNALKLSSSTTKEINKAQEAYNKTLDKEGKETADSVQAKEKLKQATEKGISADVKAAEAKKKLNGNLQKGQDIFNAVGQGVMDLGDAFGGFDDATNDAIGNIMAIGNAAFDLGKSIASGDVAGMIKAGVQLIGSVFKALSGDQKKERQIKEMADQVKNLKLQYEELGRAIDKALGEDKYKAQQNVIANLEKQKILRQQMIQKEKDKKKTDNGKIDDWKQQISDLNAKIDDLKKSIVDDILQIDVKGLADQIGDALTEGFGRGEDGLDSLNKKADDVFRQMVKNALKLQLEKQMQPIIDEMLKAMGYSVDSSGKPSGSFDGLTPEERDALKAQIIAATGDYQKAMEQYADLFGPDAANSPNGLKGDIKGVSEKTAGALESQINAIRIYQVEALNVSKRNQQIFLDALKYQAEIAYNTRELKAIRIGIDDLNSKVKKPLAGLDN